MVSMQILIAGLGAACLLVACLIVIVLLRPTPRSSRRPRGDEVEDQTLARIYALRPPPSSPSKAALDELAALANLPASAAAHLGRMPDLPDLQATLGIPDFPRHVDEPDRSLLAARIPAGPLPFERVSAEAGWGDGSEMPIGRPVTGELLPPVMPYVSAPLDSTTASSSGFLARAQPSNSIGRMPGFAPAPFLPPSPPSPPMTPLPPPPPAAPGPGRMADGTQQRRLGALTRLYAERIQVMYDPTCDAVDLSFADCPMRTPDEVALAFRVLLAKVRTVLKPMERDRAALLLDVGGLEIGAGIAPVWMGSLKEFLAVACAQTGSGRLLAVRYNSREPLAGNQQEMLKRIQNTTTDMLQGLQSSIFSSREQAVALLARLRAVAIGPGA